MDITKLFSLEYLFNTTPGSEFKYLWICAAFFLLMVVFGQYMKVLIKKNEYKKILKRLFQGVEFKLNVTALFGLISLFFRTQNIPYLAARPLLIFMLAIGLYQLGKIAYIYFKVFPNELGEFRKKEERLRYMPGKR
jgi:hypothetical protein